MGRERERSEMSRSEKNAQQMLDVCASRLRLTFVGEGDGGSVGKGEGGGVGTGVGLFVGLFVGWGVGAFEGRGVGAYKTIVKRKFK